jgi:hypothetical protein
MSMRTGTHVLAGCFSLLGQLVAVEDIKFSDILMVPCWVVFAGVVGTVEDAFLPKIFELALCIAAF